MDENRYLYSTDLDNGRSVLGPSVRYDGAYERVCLWAHGAEVELTAREALVLTGWLADRATLLKDRAEHYYDCPECGGAHHQDVKRCPSLDA